MKKSILLLVTLTTLSMAQSVRLSVPYERVTLKNGLNVIMHVDSTTPTVSVNMWYHVGSGYEKPGRTGFAHLFEHLMFMGSKNVPTGRFDELLEAAGGDNNGSTTNDRTDYYEDLPSNALELALYLDSDRLGFLTDAMTTSSVDAQRDVVKNERRQSYENRPYGMAGIMIDEALFPPGYPYSWPTIGSMADLSAASLQDVKDFFNTYYVPNNASLCVAGDIDVEKTKALVEKWFGGIPAGKPVPQQERTIPVLSREKRIMFEDHVQLPRLYMAWITPAYFSPGDAELDLLSNILAGKKNSRLYKRLVYEMQIAQDVSAYQQSQRLISQFQIVATPRAGHTLAELEQVIQEEIDKIKREPPAVRELERARNQYEASFLSRLENVGGFGGKADQLNNYLYLTGNPDYFNEDLARYFAIDTTDVSAIAQTYLIDNGRVVLSVVPKGKQELAAKNSTLVSTEGK
jgi:zinc protease